MAKKNQLNDKQIRFCQEYLKDVNATKAAKRAGYSIRTAYSQGHRLLKHVEVQKEITKRQKAQEKRTEIKSDDILLETARVAFSNLTDFVKQDAKGIKLKKLKDLTADQKACIAEMSELPLEDGTSFFKIKLYNKLKALELLGKHKKLFSEAVDHGLKADLLEVLSGLGGGGNGS